MNKKFHEIVKNKLNQKYRGLEKSICNLNELDLLKEYLGSIPFDSAVLIYNAIVDGFGASDFHGKCDGKKKIVVIIKANNYVFGN